MGGGQSPTLYICPYRLVGLAHVTCHMTIFNILDPFRKVLYRDIRSVVHIESHIYRCNKCEIRGNFDFWVLGDI
jgi:hypothetical protein